MTWTSLIIGTQIAFDIYLMWVIVAVVIRLREYRQYTLTCVETVVEIMKLLEQPNKD